MKITVNGFRLQLQENDEVELEKHFCGRCDSEHTRLTVTREGKEITRIGADITLEGEDEVYGGVVVDERGNVLPEYHWCIHIIPNDGTGMTKDRMSYIGMCGRILNHGPDTKHDRITFPSEIRFIEAKNKSRLCPECVQAYEAKKKR